MLDAASQELSGMVDNLMGNTGISYEPSYSQALMAQRNIVHTLRQGTVNHHWTKKQPTHVRIMPDNFLDDAGKVYRAIKTKLTFEEYCNMHMEYKQYQELTC